MEKWFDPKFITGLIAMAAIALNNKFMWQLDQTALIASIGLSVNFIIMQLAEDIQRIKNGQKPTWNSTKLATMFIACIIIGFSQYLGINLADDAIWTIAGVAGAIITGKGVRDVVAAKQKPQEAAPPEINDYH